MSVLSDRVRVLGVKGPGAFGVLKDALLARFRACPSIGITARRSGDTVAMYQFSRAIYRALAPDLPPPPPGAGVNSTHARVLGACEAVVERLATDRHYFARPARTLFF